MEPPPNDEVTLPTVPEGAEALSLLGQPLFRPQPAASERLEAQLGQARRDHAEEPESLEATIWVGRRLAYLGRFRDSIEWYSAALSRFGAEAKLLRHRGHRWLTVRALDRARADFEAAAVLLAGTADEVEPDGVPNERNQPVSSLHSNAWYHLALTAFLQGDEGRALAASEAGLAVSGNADRLVSQSYWRYLILRRLGRRDEAAASIQPISGDLDIIENHAYARLLLTFQGKIAADELLAQAGGDVEESTLAYGLGMHRLFEGDRLQAKALFERATSGPAWPAFGYLAAEAELARLGRAEGFGHSS